MSELLFDRDFEPPSHWAFLMMNLYVGTFQGFSLGVPLNKKIADSKRILDRTFVYIWLQVLVQDKYDNNQ